MVTLRGGGVSGTVLSVVVGLVAFNPPGLVGKTSLFRDSLVELDGWVGVVWGAGVVEPDGENPGGRNLLISSNLMLGTIASIPVDSGIFSVLVVVLGAGADVLLANRDSS